MDNLADSLGQLSTTAKEWVPGQGFSTTTSSSTRNTTASPNASPKHRSGGVSSSPSSSAWKPAPPSSSSSPNSKQSLQKKSTTSAWSTSSSSISRGGVGGGGTGNSSGAGEANLMSIRRTTSSSSPSSSSSGLKWNPGTAKEFVPTTTSSITTANANTTPATTRTATGSAWGPTKEQHHHHQSVSIMMNHSITSTTTTSEQQQQQQEAIPTNPWSTTTPLPSPTTHHEEEPKTPSTTTTTTILDPQQLKKSSIPTGSQPPPQTNTFTSNNPITQPLPRTVYNTLGLPPNETLWSLYRNMSIENTRSMKPNDERYKAIPPNFYNAMPLEQSSSLMISSSSIMGNVAASSTTTTSGVGLHDTINNSTNSTITSHHHHHHQFQNRSSFGYPSTIFKVTSEDDGNLYCLRRFDNVKCVNHKISSLVNTTWNHAIIKQSQNSNANANQQSQNNNVKYVMDHPGIVRMYKCFHIPKNHRALFFLHHYYPNALTLQEAVYGLGGSGLMMAEGGGRGRLGLGGGGVTEAMMRGGYPPLPEETIWSYVTQLVSAIRAVHGANLACRTLQMNHILVTPDVGSGSSSSCSTIMDESSSSSSLYLTNRVRLRINCIGVVDALEFEARKPIVDLQKEDIRALGRIILSLASGTEIGADVTSTSSNGESLTDTMTRCDVYMRQNYSPTLHNLAMALIARSRNNTTGGGGRMGMGMMMMPLDPPSIEEVCRVVTDRVFDEMDSANAVVDGMEEALVAEFESGRAVRLLTKLGFVNERPEFGVDRRWSETGDCYVLKLFRDYVFHQADGSGRPVMDIGHVVTALNKLDASDPEKIVLASRDGKSIMVVSYADVARCLENAYAELCANSVTPQMLAAETQQGNMGY